MTRAMEQTAKVPDLQPSRGIVFRQLEGASQELSLPHQQIHSPLGAVDGAGGHVEPGQCGGPRLVHQVVAQGNQVRPVVEVEVGDDDRGQCLGGHRRPQALEHPRAAVHQHGALLGPHQVAGARAARRWPCLVAAQNG